MISLIILAALAWCSSLSCLTFAEASRAKEALKPIAYPYSALENKPLTIFAHGSLIDQNSAAKTFSDETLMTRTPALAFGLRRVFDRDVPIETAPHWGTPIHPRARGMLNVYPSQQGDMVNGVLMEVQPSDFNPLRAREIGYDLIPVVVAVWDEYLQTPSPDYRIAYTLHAPEESPYTNPKVLPRPGYYEMARDAAKKFGPAFYKLWMQSTYLADKRTPISDWDAHISSSN